MNRFNNQRGTILALTAMLLLGMCILFAGAVEVGRWAIAREQAQTAVDSASLAASMSGVHRWVKIDVVTDRGAEWRCNNVECWCRECNRHKVKDIIGLETELIETDDWKLFCVPECDCGGGSCWYELKDRWVTYEIESWAWGTEDPEEIKRVVNELTASIKLGLANQCKPNEFIFWTLYGSDTLKEIYNQSEWFDNVWGKAYHKKLITYDCYDKMQRSPNLCKDNECKNMHKKISQIYSALNKKRAWLGKAINQLDKLKTANDRTGGTIGRKLDTIADMFYGLNMPDRAESSNINRLNVHGMRGDPYYPTVTAYAKVRINSLFPKMFGTSHSAEVCGQGDTFYRDPGTQEGRQSGPLNAIGKWIKAPPEACWND